MKPFREPVRFISLQEEVAGVLFLPPEPAPAPVLVVCHGAGEFKENHFEMCELLAGRGVACLAIDMHGHGESGGKRFHVSMTEWVADIRAAIDFLARHPRVDPNRIAAFGLSSGGTAVLEAAVVDRRLRVLVTLDPTVYDSLPLFTGMFLRSLDFLGRVKKRFTNDDLRVSLLRFGGKSRMVSDPEIERRLRADARAREAFEAFPFPGGSEAFFVDTIERVDSITAPTLILWGAEDKLDPPSTGQRLFEALRSRKSLNIIPGNGHAGHLDRNRSRIFALTFEWLSDNLCG
ncbi:MAG TPA: alpha/beta fold hydrolase [Verrucomicrobiae bacterium]|nr:alpha/beta fold hydrolase [Verrucomicrobiae bacterium]